MSPISLSKNCLHLHVCRHVKINTTAHRIAPVALRKQRAKVRRLCTCVLLRLGTRVKLGGGWFLSKVKHLFVC